MHRHRLGDRHNLLDARLACRLDDRSAKLWESLLVEDRLGTWVRILRSVLLALVLLKNNYFL
jgi:hypothetical protein